jgi:hypothetical protein
VEHSGGRVTTLRDIHRYINQRASIALTDGRTGKITRVDTFFPKNETIVRVWIQGATGPGVVKVGLADVAGPSDPT